MRNRWFICLVLLAGCPPVRMPEHPGTVQVNSTPFTESRRPAPTKVNYAPASQAASFRAVMMRDKLLADNRQVGIQPTVTAIGAADPEIFHVGMNQIFITEGLIRQCQTDGQLAAVLANEMGRMISEREASVSDDVRSPEKPLPIRLPIGGAGHYREADPINHVELAKYEKANPKQATKLSRPNPQLIAREVLDRAGYARTELDAALPILQDAERNQVLQAQFNGPPKQGDWRAP